MALEQPLNKVGKVVDEHGEVRDGGQIVVTSDGRARIRYRGKEVRDEMGVAFAGEGPLIAGQKSWKVEFASGAVWTVTPRVSRGGCRSCGGGR